MERHTSSAAARLWPSLRRRSWYSRIPSSSPPATCASICRYRLAVSKSCHYLVHFRRNIRISSLIARRLSGAGFKVVGSPRYLAKFGKPKRIEDLADHNCLAFTFREARLARAWRFIQEGVEKSLTPKGNMSFSDGAAVCDAACAGYGLAQLQDCFADSAIAQGKLVSLLDRFKPKIEPIWLVYPQTRHLTPTVRAFVDFMAAQFRPRQTKS